MINKKNILLSLFLSVSLALPLLSVFNPITVHASGDEFSFPAEYISDSFNPDQYRNYFAMLKRNPEFISSYPDKYVVMFYPASDNKLSLRILNPNTFHTTYAAGTGTLDFYTGKYTISTPLISSLDSFSFTTREELLPSQNTNQYYNCLGVANSVDWFSGVAFTISTNVVVSPISFNPAAIFSGTNERPFDPVLDPLYTATYDLSINEKEFVKWLIDTRKYTDIVSDMLSSHVADTVSIFKRFGGNNQVFSLSLKQYFDKTNIGQTIKDYNTVVSKIRQLYRQFETERKQQLLDKFYNRTDDTDNIKPLTSDTNNSLIIDSSSDDIVTKLLRDILRSLIALPHNMRDFAFMIIDRLDSLDNTVNIVNDSGIAPLDDLWSYSQSDFDDDLNQFSADVAESQQLPVSYVSDINNNPLMPEKMLSDKDSLTVNIPNMSGFTVSDDFKSFSTQTTTYILNSSQYPWLDPLVKKIKRFATILLIIGYLIHLRYKMPEIIRGE